MTGMTALSTTLCFAFLCGHLLAKPSSDDDIFGLKKRNYLIGSLFQKIADDQVKHDQPFIALQQFAKKKGAYTSDVKLNFHGEWQTSEIRRLLNVPDNNMFVTAWVTTQLLEATRYKNVPFQSENQLALALNSIADNHDHNQKYNTSLMTFWSQKYDSNVNFYQSLPENLVGFVNSTYELPLNSTLNILSDLGYKVLAKKLEGLLQDRTMYMDAFHIPPDFDDTFVNLGLGSLLKEMKTKFPDAYTLWMKQNQNTTSVFTALKHYAYRPFKNDSSVNTVDPRTYFWLRHFLDQAKFKGNDVALVPTWIQNIEEVRTQYGKGVAMPFNVNNVDATVCSNTIYGITSSVLSGLVSPAVLDDPEVQKIYLNTTSLVAFAINQNMSSRVDLVLTYYPSRFEFYWFVARTFSELVTAKNKGSLPHKAVVDVYGILLGARQNMTTAILSKAKPEKDNDKKQFYFDDFLGDNDEDMFNVSLARGEDRMFTTAMACNALLYSWTVYNETTRTSKWAENSTDTMKQIINGSIDWLSDNIEGTKYKPWNAFFSGSGKGFESLPFWYPINRYEFLNGTKIEDRSHFQNISTPYILGIEGYVPLLDYMKMVDQTHFGVPTPRDFHGYNYGDSYFPFWSSPTYTYSTTLLAFARFNSIEE